MAGAQAFGGVRESGGRLPAWVPLAVVLLGVVGLVRRMDREVADHGLATIDVTRYRLHAPERWISEAWIQRLERLLTRVGTVSATDRGQLDALVAEIEALSFVEEVGEPEVAWPDGLTLPVRLYEPVACIRVGRDFLPVAADGTVLAGYSYAPHPARGGHLPVLGPHGLDADPERPFQPGDVLTHPAHLAALAVAVSLRQHLDRTDRARLGRVVIDASRERAFDDRPGGVFLDLEGARRIHFGRPPVADQPGELPVELKWRSVSAGLEAWARGEDFDALDVRWDVPQTLSFDQAVGAAPTERAGRDDPTPRR